MELNFKELFEQLDETLKVKSIYESTLNLLDTYGRKDLASSLITKINDHIKKECQLTVQEMQDGDSKV